MTLVIGIVIGVAITAIAGIAYFIYLFKDMCG